MVFSASHNTAEYVGIKIVDKEAKFFKTVDLKAMFEELGHDIEVGDSLPEIVEHETDKLDVLFADMRSRYAELDMPLFTIDYSN